MIQRIITILVILTVLVVPLQAQERFDAPPYAQAGPYAVGTMELTLEDDTRPLTVTVWYPAQAEPGEEPDISYKVTNLFALPGTGYRDAEPLADEGPYPLVVYSHGNDGARVVSLFLTEHLASQGFVVIAADHAGNNIETRLSGTSDFLTAYTQRPLDVIRQIDYAADVLNAEGGLLAGLIDMEHVGVMGHSFGGWTALAVAGARSDFAALNTYCETADETDNACSIQGLQVDVAAFKGYNGVPDSPMEADVDPRIDAVIAMAPWNGPVLEMSQISVPTLIMVGGDDSVAIPERDAYSFYERLESPRSLMTLALGDHYLFVDSCSTLFETLNYEYVCSDPVWDMDRAHDLINHVATAFLLSELKGDSDASAALQPDALDFRGVDYQHD